MKSLTKKFSKTQKNIKKQQTSSIPVSKKDTPTKQKAAVVLEKMTKEEKKLDESLDFAVAAVEEKKKELDKSLDWLDVEDVSFFDVGTNVFSSGSDGSVSLKEGEVNEVSRVLKVYVPKEMCVKDLRYSMKVCTEK